MQSKTIKRTILQTLDVQGTDDQTTMAISVLAPDAESHRHTHPGPEAGYVLKGAGSIIAEGKKPVVLKPGASYQLPAGVPHVLKSGADGVELLAIWTIKKNAPLSTDMV